MNEGNSKAVYTVLCVDDEASILSALRRLFRPEGYRVLTAEGGAAGLAVMETEAVDLVISDMRMPEMSGAQFLEQVRARWPDTVRLLLTGHSDMASTIDAINKGQIYRYLSKPWEEDDMLITVRQALERKTMERENLRLTDLTRQQNAELKTLNEGLETLVHARTEELRETRLEVVRSLGRAAEFRDNETGMHIVRMSRFSQLLAEALGLGRDRAELILHASPMHDIGKVGIPDRILLKPDKLTPDEWEIMKTHATIGHRILDAEKTSDLMDAAKTIALGHHEKWDGSGYPHGLAGEAIPIEARIASISDVFDALTSERPYKHAWSVAEAMTEIGRLRGTHFEPQLVDVFKDILPDILAIREQHLDVPGESLALSALT